MRSLRTKRDEKLDISIIFLAVALIIFIVAKNVYPQITIGDPLVDGTKKTTGRDKSSELSRSEIKRTNTTSTDEPPEWFVKVVVGDINDAKADVDSYTPEGKIYLVRSPLAPWLLRAVSQKAREAFAVDKKFQDWRKATPGNKYDTGLDALAASAAQKLPSYIPGPKNFVFRDPTMEKVMKDKLKNLATLKVHKIGLFHSSWVIEKDSSGFPANRYREAYIWAKDSADDHPYCHLYGFIVQQDYAGGGAYGATGVILNTDALFGCPAN